MRHIDSLCQLTPIVDNGPKNWAVGSLNDGKIRRHKQFLHQQQKAMGTWDCIARPLCSISIIGAHCIRTHSSFGSIQ